MEKESVDPGLRNGPASAQIRYVLHCGGNDANCFSLTLSLFRSLPLSPFLSVCFPASHLVRNLVQPASGQRLCETGTTITLRASRCFPRPLSQFSLSLRKFGMKNAVGKGTRDVEAKGSSLSGRRAFLHPSAFFSPGCAECGIRESAIRSLSPSFMTRFFFLPFSWVKVGRCFFWIVVVTDSLSCSPRSSRQRLRKD